MHWDMKAQVFANALEQNAIVAFDGMVQSLDINALNKVLDAISSTSGNPDFKLKKASVAPLWAGGYEGGK